MGSFGKKTHDNKYWFEENINVLLPLIKVKRQAHVECQHDQSSTSLNRLREARKVFRRTARKCANEFWLKTSASIKAAADRADTKSVYDGIRKAVGPTKKLTARLQFATGEILHSREHVFDFTIRSSYPKLSVDHDPPGFVLLKLIR